MKFKSQSYSLGINARDSFLNTATSIFDEFFNQTCLADSPVQTDLNGLRINAYRREVDQSSMKVQRPSHYEMVVDLFVPYATRGDIEIEAQENTNSLSINVASRQDKRVKESDYFIRQVPRGSVRQTVSFEADCRVMEATADLNDGILRIVVPIVGNKSSYPQKRKLQIGERKYEDSNQ